MHIKNNYPQEENRNEVFTITLTDEKISYEEGYYWERIENKDGQLVVSIGGGS